VKLSASKASYQITTGAGAVTLVLPVDTLLEPLVDVEAEALPPAPVWADA